MFFKNYSLAFFRQTEINHVPALRSTDFSHFTCTDGLVPVDAKQFGFHRCAPIELSLPPLIGQDSKISCGAELMMKDFSAAAKFNKDFSHTSVCCCAPRAPESRIPGDDSKTNDDDSRVPIHRYGHHTFLGEAAGIYELSGAC